MQGKHLYLRHINAHGSEGTWTAAITADILSSTDVATFIEPHCNIDEAFANACLVGESHNGVLRVYHPKKQVTVITRSYCEADRITNNYRRYPYSVSHILTGPDAVRYSEEFGNAFSEQMFETYDALVNRLQVSRTDRITLGNVPDFFAGKHSQPDSGIFLKLGFTCDSFVQMMEGIYAAIDQKSCAAVILPRAARQAWMKFGDPSAEQLIHSILCLLPPWLRMRFGFASHWNSVINNEMLKYVHFVCVHDDRAELIKEMNSFTSVTVDLDTGEYQKKISVRASEYFSYLWEHLGNQQAVDAIWRFGQQNYDKLLNKNPADAGRMECIFLLYLSSKVPEDAALKRRAFLRAASAFAGAGSIVPAAENFIAEYLDEYVQIEGILSDSDMEQAVMRLTKEDTTKTKHQRTEYQLLINTIAEGRAQKDSIEVLSKEINKPKRNAEQVFVDFLQEQMESLQQGLVEGNALLVHQLYRTVLSDKAHHETLHDLILQVLEKWIQVIETTKCYEKIKILFPLIQQYLHQNEIRPKLDESIYRCMFEAEQQNDEQLVRSTSEFLHEEEKRLSKAQNTEVNQRRLAAYATGFMRIFPLANLPEEKALGYYHRMYRLMCTSGCPIREQTDAYYQQELRAAMSIDMTFLQRFIQCQTDEIKSICQNPSIWPSENLKSAFSIIERCNLQIIDNYCPSYDRLNIIARVFRDDRPHYRTLIRQYCLRMQPKERQKLFCDYLDDTDRKHLYVQCVLFGNNEIAEELSSMDVVQEKRSVRNLFFSYPEIQSDEVRSIATQCFEDWYEAALEEEYNNCSLVLDKNGIPMRLQFLIDERRSLFQMDTKMCNGLWKAAVSRFSRFAEDKLKVINPAFSTALSKNELEEIFELAPQAKGIPLISAINRINRIDPYCDGIERWIRNLETICQNAAMDSPADRAISQNRIRWKADQLRSKNRADEARKLEIFLTLIRLDAQRKASDESISDGFDAQWNPNVDEQWFSLEEYAKDSDYCDLDDEIKVSNLLALLALFNYANSMYRNVICHPIFDELYQLAKTKPQTFDTSMARQAFKRISNPEYQSEKKKLEKYLAPKGISLSVEYNEEDTWSHVLWSVLGAGISVVFSAAVGVVLFLLFTKAGPFVGTIAALLSIAWIVVSVLRSFSPKRTGDNNRRKKNEELADE